MTLLRRRNPKREELAIDEGRSFGSALDEVGWQPQPKIGRLTHRVDKTPLQTRAALERATEDIAAEGLLGGPSRVSTELEVMDEASDIFRAAHCDRSAKGG
ncbi:hypothetical protein BTR14_01580 [Rhizobium rhizosphaerae]|uniref:Transposase n=1 Tax=Xaviernesmea rhizosphaerae TaxID=1672749 RepID=A0ABX3PJQ8_9HYPH|nr:hypothetical protein BTR14_01580 [Xaviernesmea rhizosphaerae]